MLIGQFVDGNGNKLENSPEFKEMVATLVWSLQKAKSWGNSKGNVKIEGEANKGLNKYIPMNEAVNGKT